MKIQINKTTGIIEDVKQDILRGGSPMNTRRCIVIHYTEGGSGASSIEWWNTTESRRIDLGAHFVIERDGTITQCRALNKTISHAGVSRWRDPKTGILYKNCNGFSIGIELANSGTEGGHIKGVDFSQGNTITAHHRNGGSTQRWECFSITQALACKELCQNLVTAFNLDDVTGHDCIAPERKTDPGPAFDEFMKNIREACGFGHTLPVVHKL